MLRLAAFEFILALGVCHNIDSLDRQDRTMLIMSTQMQYGSCGCSTRCPQQLGHLSDFALPKGGDMKVVQAKTHQVARNA